MVTLALVRTRPACSTCSVLIVLEMLASWYTHEVLLATVVSSVEVIVVTTPHALRIVGGRVPRHCRFLSVVDGRASVHRLTSIDTASIDIRLGTSSIRLLGKFDEFTVNGDDLALRTQLNLRRSVVCIGDTATMALKLSTYNDYKLTHVRISDESILVGHGRALNFLQELGTENLRISTVLHENSI